MKISRRKISFLLCLCFLMLFFPVNTYATAGSVSVTSASGTVGNTVSVTCTMLCASGAIGGAQVDISYSPRDLEYISGSGGGMISPGMGSVSFVGATPNGTNRSISFSMNFKILTQGSHQVSVTKTDLYDIEETYFTPSITNGTITGTIPSSPPTPSTPQKPGNSGGGNQGGNNNGAAVAPDPSDTRDGNCKLSSLQVYPGTLSPEFNPDVTEYSMSLPKDTKELTVSATPQSEKATVSVTGANDLKPGKNQVNVIVTAENGTSLAYTITAQCGEGEGIKIGGQTYGINEEFTDEMIPDGFTRTKVTYDKREYEGLTHFSGKVLLINLKNENGTNFFIYLQKEQEFYPFTTLNLTQDKTVIPLPPKGHKKELGDAEIVTLDIQGKSLDGWKIDRDFQVICALTQEGEEVLYRYDAVDGTLQRHIASGTVVKAEKTWFPNIYYLYAIAGLVALCVILSATLIYFVASRKRRQEKRKKKMRRKMEKQRAKEEGTE